MPAVKPSCSNIALLLIVCLHLGFWGSAAGDEISQLVVTIGKTACCCRIPERTDPATAVRSAEIHSGFLSGVCTDVQRL